jgi:hypothetical protein
MSNLCVSYNKILGLLHELEPADNFLKQVRTPKLSDKQPVALALSAGSLGIGSERYLSKQLPGNLASQIERSVFNRRRRGLKFMVEQFRQRMTAVLVPSEGYYFVDSMPLEVCKAARCPRVPVFAKMSMGQHPATAIVPRTTRITSVIKSMRFARPKVLSKPSISQP